MWARSARLKRELLHLSSNISAFLGLNLQEASFPNVVWLKDKLAIATSCFEKEVEDDYLSPPVTENLLPLLSKPNVPPKLLEVETDDDEDSD